MKAADLTIDAAVSGLHPAPAPRLRPHHRGHLQGGVNPTRLGFRTPPRPAAQDSQLVLRRFESFSLSGIDLFARPVDVEGQHGHRRAERIRPSTLAALGGSLQRQSNFSGIGPSEDTRLQVQRVAGPGDVSGPEYSLVSHPAVSLGVSLGWPQRW